MTGWFLIGQSSRSVWFLRGLGNWFIHDWLIRVVLFGLSNRLGDWFVKFTKHIVRWVRKKDWSVKFVDF